MTAFMHQMQLQQQQFMQMVSQQLASTQPKPTKATACGFRFGNGPSRPDEADTDNEVTFKPSNAANPPPQQKPFKISGRAPSFCIEKDKENFLIWKEDWSCFLFSSGINHLKDEED